MLIWPLFCASTALCGQLIHTIDYETGDFSEWRTCSECSFGGSNPRIVSSPVRRGNKAARFESTDHRTEAASERFLDRETDLWVGWSVYVEKFADSPGRADVTQFHGYQPECNSNDPKIHVDIKRLKWGITINYYEGGTKITVDKSGLKAVQKGKWTDMVANFKLTETNSGYFNFWIDGEKVLAYKGKTSGNCPLGHYLKAGVYNCPSGAVVYNDAFTIMKNASYADVAPDGSGPVGGGDDDIDTLGSSACVAGATTWSNYSIDSHTGSFTLHYAATPDASNLDGIVALSDIAGADYTDYAMLVRFSREGVVDARNGEEYAAENSLSYSAGQTVYLTIDGDVGARTYSVTATRAGGSPVRIATDYSFRTEKASIAEVSHLGLVTATGTLELCTGAVQAGRDEVSSRQLPAVPWNADDQVAIYSPAGRLVYRGRFSEFGQRMTGRRSRGAYLVWSRQSGRIRRLVTTDWAGHTDLP